MEYLLQGQVFVYIDCMFIVTNLPRIIDFFQIIEKSTIGYGTFSIIWKESSFEENLLWRTCS